MWGQPALAVRSSEARLRGCRRSRALSLPFATPAPQIGSPASVGTGDSPVPPSNGRRIVIIFHARSVAREQDILKRRSPNRPPRLTSRRIGIHISSAGGVHNAAERAYRLGCNTFQVFSSSSRQWAQYELGELQCAEMNRLRTRSESEATGDSHELPGEPGQFE